MKNQILKNQRGQTLIEYLIIVALVGVGSIALVRTVAQNINHRFAKVVTALGGTVDEQGTTDHVTKSMISNHDLRNFFNKATKSNKSSSGSDHDSPDSAE